LSYISEASYGDMRDLVKDLDIVPEKLEFLNVGDLIKSKEKLIMGPYDH